jgi:hypothetical protein
MPTLHACAESEWIDRFATKGCMQVWSANSLI